MPSLRDIKRNPDPSGQSGTGFLQNRLEQISDRLPRIVLLLPNVCGLAIEHDPVVHNQLMTSNEMQIGEAADATGVLPKTLRYYEEIGLVKPTRTDSGYRLYDAKALERIYFILKAKTLGFTLVEISDVLTLKDDETEPCDHVASLIESRLADIEVRIKNLSELRVELTNVRDSHIGESAGPCRGTICHLIEGTEGA